jgi:hypothetical protein
VAAVAGRLARGHPISSAEQQPWLLKQGLKPDYTIGDAGQGLRAGQKAAWDSTPCHGDVFHVTRQYEGLANTLSRQATGARSRCQELEAKIGRTGQLGPDGGLAVKLARQTET